jgi:hypothetical protein
MAITHGAAHPGCGVQFGERREPEQAGQLRDLIAGEPDPLLVGYYRFACCRCRGAARRVGDIARSSVETPAALARGIGHAAVAISVR